MADEHLMSLQPGTVIAGRYEVVKCLGAGSMGLVYACRHRELTGHMVAVKVLFPEVAQDKIAAARFRNEIFASYGVSHPNVVRAYEYLRDGDLVAYTMEYVGGGDLADRLGRPQDLIPIPEAVRLLSEMCAGVQAIHDAQIVHRDLKPENILLTKDNHVKIADFGIARTGHGPKLTEHGGVVGTIDYVSPEYMLNSQVDWRSDIYAIGILGYEMLTGESPFRGDSVYATMTKRLKSDPTLPSALRPECPQELDRIVLKAMHRSPELRYQAAIEMFYDLQAMMPEQANLSGSYMLPNRGQSAAYVGPTVSPGTGSTSGSAARDVTRDAPEAMVVNQKVTPSYDEPRSGTQSGQLGSSSSEQLGSQGGVQPGGMYGSRAISQRSGQYNGFPQGSAGAGSQGGRFQDANGGDGAYASGPYSGDQYGSQQYGSDTERRYNSNSNVSAKPHYDVAETMVINSEIEHIASHYEEDKTIHEPVKMERVLAYNDMASSPHSWENNSRMQRGSGDDAGVRISAGVDDDKFKRLSQIADQVNRSIWVDIATLILAVVLGVGLGFTVLKLIFPDIISHKSSVVSETGEEQAGQGEL